MTENTDQHDELTEQVQRELSTVYDWGEADGMGEKMLAKDTVTGLTTNRTIALVRADERKRICEALLSDATINAHLAKGLEKGEWEEIEKNTPEWAGMLRAEQRVAITQLLRCAGLTDEGGAS